MDVELERSLTQQNHKIEAMRGEVKAIKGVLAVLIAHIALLTRAPHAKREEILRNLEGMLPSALAQIEHEASPASAAGFEQLIETLTHMARHAVRFEPVQPNQAGPAKDWNMQDIVQDPLAGLLEAKMDEALANGADVRELAAIAIDTIRAEATQLLEQHAAALTAGMTRLQPHGFAYLHERAMRDGVLDAAERLLSMQFSGPVPAPTRR